MQTIRVKFYGDVMYINFVKNYKGNMNTCKMTEHNEFFFSEDYLIRNLDTLQFYITPTILQNQVTKVILSNKKLLTCTEKLLNLYSIITDLYIESDDELTISDAKIIINMNYIKNIDCYNIEEDSYYMLKNKYNKNIELRSEILFESSFMNKNKIDSYSKLFNTKKVYIDKELNVDDKEEFEYFLKHNRTLEKIILEKYSKETVKYLNPIIKKKKITLSVINDEQLDNQNFNYLKTLKKSSNTQLELDYTKQYKRKNAMKQLNVNLLRFCMILVVFVCVGFASAEKFIFEQDKENIESIDLTQFEEIIEEPQEVVPEEEIVVEEPIIEEPQEVVVEEPPQPVYVSPYYQTYSQKFADLKQINPDTVAWIKVNNTSVNYPVVKTTNNEYYLNHSFDKTTNNFGWIYADYRSNFDTLNQNTILYGHNVIGTNLLFSTLTKTADPSWYNNTNNLTITFNTEQGNMKWQVFSIYVIPVTNDYLITNFNSPESFLNFVQKMKDRSVKDFGVEVLGTDKILTLSTCYKDSSKRVVIHAKKI